VRKLIRIDPTSELLDSEWRDECIVTIMMYFLILFVVSAYRFYYYTRCSNLMDSDRKMNLNCILKRKKLKFSQIFQIARKNKKN